MRIAIDQQCPKPFVMENKVQYQLLCEQVLQWWNGNYEFNFNCTNEVNNHDKANVLHCGKAKLYTILHRFGMFTLMTEWAAVYVST